MQGQWLESYSADPPAIGIVDIEERGDHFEGSAVVYYGEEKPAVIMAIRTRDRAPHQVVTAKIVPFRVGDPRALSHEEALKLSPGWSGIATEARITLTMEGTSLRVGWEADGVAPDSRLVAPSLASTKTLLEPVSEIRSWSEFKSFASNPAVDQLVFRGQGDASWRLRTRFHRTGRVNMYRYQVEDINAAYASLSPITSHRYDMANDEDYASFLHLLQHHGFPTPLLDWTRSPYIAAYFAFADDIPAQLRSSDSVRIHIFDANAWGAHHNRSRGLAYAGPHVSTLVPIAIDNPRAAPQQSLSTFTNLDDVEWFVRAREEHLNYAFLKAVDLPLSERAEALRDLSRMNISAREMFPGIEGACRALKQRLFDFAT